MKQMLSLSIAIIVSMIYSSSANDKKPASWGYLLHTSSFTDNYREKIIPLFSVICMTGFKITESGDVFMESAGMTEKIKSMTGKYHVIMYPLISFRTASQGHTILNSSILREKSARSIAAFARSMDFMGIHLDLEYLPPDDAVKLGEFLTALRKAFPGKISMAVFPPSGFPEKWSRFHDLETISSRVDEIVLMCYDYHGSHTGPGPVTDTTWAETNIRIALKFIKPSHLWLGIPAYGYRWCEGRATPLSARQAARLGEEHAPVRDHSGNLRFSYSEAGRDCTVYYSDRQTRFLLTKLATQYGLAGTALWRIGFEE